MSTKINTTVHNRFDIYKTDTRTGETKQVAFAENIVLNQMWTRLCNRSAYFVNIHFGTGDGTLDATRTTLFNYIGTKVAIDDVLTKALPMASWRRKIVLNPEDNVGVLLSEVGIAFGASTGYLVTHALLKDMNGNVVKIGKSETDLITIYATIYVTFSVSNSELKLCGMPSSNPLMNYLIGGTAFPSCFFYSGECNITATEADPAIISNLLGTSPLLTWTANLGNKSAVSSTIRFAVGDSNGYISEIGMGSAQATPILRQKLPASVYTGLKLTGVNSGTGDGTNNKFVLPSRNIDDTTLKMYVDGALVTALVSHHIPTPVRSGVALLGQRVIAPISRNGSRLGIMANSDSHADWLNFKSYSVANLATTLLGTYPDTASGPSSLLRAALSGNGLVAVRAFSTTPFFEAYDWAAEAWTKRANPTSLPAGACNGCYLTDDGSTVVLAHANSPFVSVYDWSSIAWTKRANPALLPAGIGRSCSLSTNGLVMAIGHDTAPFITTYDWAGGAWVKRNNPTDLPMGECFGCALSDNGLILALAHAVTPFFTVYDWSAGAWAKRANPTSLPTGTGKDCALSADGTTLVFGCEVTPFFNVYKWINSKWEKADNPTSLQTGPCLVFISKDGLIMSAGQGNGPSYLYELNSYKTQVTFNNPPLNGAVITADYTVKGIHKTIQRVIDMQCTITFGEPA